MFSLNAVCLSGLLILQEHSEMQYHSVCTSRLFVLCRYFSFTRLQKSMQEENASSVFSAKANSYFTTDKINQFCRLSLILRAYNQVSLFCGYTLNMVVVIVQNKILACYF